jgi:hypothetical protein
MAIVTYPVSYEIERPERYNRLTVLFRPILAIPHLILVGGSITPTISGNGALSAVLGILVLFAWFAILFTGRFPESFRGLCLMIFRWQQNVHAYILLQANPYPPFGDGPYPLDLRVTPAEEYNRWAVAFRLILIIPHLVVLIFLGIAQAIVTLIAWFAILFTGQYPRGLYDFSVGVSRWAARVGAYAYLFVDEYPPFSLQSEPGEAATARSAAV